MIDRPSIFIVLTLSILASFASLSARAEDSPRPNVLIVLADDLGFSDLGCYGSEIKTPQLDALAKGGLRFTQFYNTARCWPTRASLLTGYYAQQVRRDSLPGIVSGGRGKRPDWAPLLPARLRPLGYRTYHSGKWHLDGKPTETGFDRSYYLADQGRFFNPQRHFEDDQPLPSPALDSGFYGTTAIADHAVRCLKDHAAKHAGRPFFHYLAFTAPHFPLHALPEDIARYRDVYRRGWDAIRADRWERVQREGIVTNKLSAVEREVGPPYHFPDHLKILGDDEVNRPIPWDDLTESQKEFQAAKMAIHAAMIDRMDRELGRVLDQIRAMRAFENTLVFFFSDNGASAEIMVRSDGHDRTAAPGSAASYLCLGPGWSTAANTPMRRHKTWVHEGGIATPLIAHWPAGIADRGSLRHNPGHVIDLAATVLDIAGCSVPEAGPSPPGRSLVPIFKADSTDPRHDNIWWSHGGNRAIRIGNWKLVSAKDNPWSLYDLSTDRTETTDLAAKHPERVKEMAAAWETKQQKFIEDLGKR